MKRATGGASGVLLALDGAGVLVCGRAGSGKSTLALELLDRGHVLIADDALLIERHDDELIGRAIGPYAGFLQLPELGVIDVARHYGAQAVATSCRLQLAVELGADLRAARPFSGCWRRRRLLGRRLPQLGLAAGTRSRALLIERALHELAERRAGRHAGRELLRRQRVERTRGDVACA